MGVQTMLHEYQMVLIVLLPTSLLSLFYKGKNKIKIAIIVLLF